jgi:outer membrane protein TolC
MGHVRSSRRSAHALRVALAGALLVPTGRARAEERPLALPPPHAYHAPGPTPLASPAPAPCDKPLPINLPTALQLAQVRPLDVAIASERIRLACAELQQARLLWLPTVYLGVDYYRHDGQVQDIPGDVFGTSKSGLLLGAGPSAVFAVSDAIFAPLAARQVVRARDADLQAAANDTLLAVARAYFTVQHARGQLAGALDTVRRAEALARRTAELPPEIAPAAEAARTHAELARCRVAAQAARERWQLASAELTRLLRLTPCALIEPLEPPHLLVQLVHPQCHADELLPLALACRPELTSQQALVQASWERLRQERLRPLIPSLLLRGASTHPGGTLAGGVFGGGRNGRLGDFSARSDFDVQVVWEWQNLGLGNVARVDARKAEHHLTLLEQARSQERVAAEVVQALAAGRSAAARLWDAEQEVRGAVQAAERSLQGLPGKNKEEPRPATRPQEAVAALQALARAYSDYYAAVADYNVAQFALYRALGNPAQELTERGLLGAPTAAPGPCPPAAVPAELPQPAAAAPPPPVASPEVTTGCQRLPALSVSPPPSAPPRPPQRDAVLLPPRP